MVKTQTAVRVNADREFEVVEVPVRDPEAGEVRIQVLASGVCHSDVVVKDALWPDLVLPRVPGHEVVGRIDALGKDAHEISEGDLVGVGWHGGHCFTCERCREGDFQLCENGSVCGVTYDGGYQEYVVVPREAVARVPESLDPVSAAPMLCAGVTTYNALRNSGARPGDLVAILGIGGLGHLGIQFAHHMGFRTVAVSGGSSKRDLSLSFGAEEYVDAGSTDVSEALNDLGGARVVLATAPSARSMAAALDGLGPNGVLLVLGLSDEPIPVLPLQLISRRARVQGWPSGHAGDSEDTLSFAALRGIEAMVETYPLAKASAAFDRMMSNDARFRCVLVPQEG